MNDLVSTAAADRTPVHFEEGDKNTPDDLLASAGIGQSTALKASLWRSAMAGVQSSVDYEFLAFVHHRTGAKVWNEANPDALGTPGTFTVHSFDEKQTWFSDGDVEYAHFYLPFKLISGVAESLFDAEFDLNKVQPVLGARDPMMLQLMEVAGRHLFRSSAPTKMALDSWSILFAETFLRRLTRYGEAYQQTAFGKLPNKGIARVIDYIEAHIGEDLGLKELAEIAAMSVYHLSRSFKATMNETPHAYIMRRRIEIAQNLLQTTDLSLAEVAYACGFSNQSHFTNVFGVRTGLTPGRYRQEWRK